MRIGLRINRHQIQRWHSVLLDQLSGDFQYAASLIEDVGGAPAPPEGAAGRPASLEGLLLLERTISGGACAYLTQHIATGDLDPARGTTSGHAQPDLVIDLTGCRKTAANAKIRTLCPLFDGLPGEAAFWSALLDGRAPVLSVIDWPSGRTTTLALPALESPHRISESADAVLMHLIGALKRIVREVAEGRPIPEFATKPEPKAPATDIHGRAAVTASTSVLMARIRNKAAEARDALLKNAPVWQVAYRRAGQRTLPGEALPYSLFQRLSDDGQRYYADPFIVTHEGWHHVFVEEFPYDTGRGVISHFVIDSDGKASRPMVVLEEPHHLSYPQVFYRDGQFWMMPEASAAGRLDLYRAERFPDRWVHHATLLETPVHDSTFYGTAERCWIFAGVQTAPSSSWDTLSLYSSSSLEGPWVAHAANPVLVDARSARPAGDLFVHKGSLWRPAQDCAGGYGAALTFNRIDFLTPDTFAQTLVSTIHFGAGASTSGPHTINFSGGVEVIDLFVPRP